MNVTAIASRCYTADRIQMKWWVQKRHIQIESSTFLPQAIISQLNACLLLLDSFKACFQVLDQILIIFNPDRESHEAGCDTQFFKAFFG